MISMTRYVGVAPGTTSMAFGATADYPPYPPPGGGPGVPPYPTQAWLVPTPANEDRVVIAVPPNQMVTGNETLIVSVPNAQKTMGPAPTDYDLAINQNYQPHHKGWINSKEGFVYNLQGEFGQKMHFKGGLGQEAMSSGTKWAIAASVVSALAIGTTAVIAILEYKRRRR